MRLLIEAAEGKDNNFNLIRLIAALAVMVTHSFVLTAGDPKMEPLRNWLGMTLGDFAVDAFFITSGFLVAASLARRKSALDFACARVLRVYPALLVMLGLTVFVLGTALTRLPAAEYLTHLSTFKYLVQDATLVFGVAYVLPGVFESNPYRSAVNGSLWSMPWELRMYLLLLALWFFAKLAGRRRPVLWGQLVLAVFAAAAIAHIAVHFLRPDAAEAGLRLSFMFFSGAAFYVLRRHVVLSHRWAGAALLALCVSLVSREAFFVAYCATFAYLLLWLAYVPAGAVRRFNRVGDYSYGTYIYAFPIQQLTAALVPGISVLSMVLISGSATLALAMLSWHLIEQRALQLKDRVSQSIRRLVFAAPRDSALQPGAPNKASSHGAAAPKP